MSFLFTKIQMFQLSIDTYIGFMKNIIFFFFLYIYDCGLLFLCVMCCIEVCLKKKKKKKKKKRSEE